MKTDGFLFSKRFPNDSSFVDKPAAFIPIILIDFCLFSFLNLRLFFLIGLFLEISDFDSTSFCVFPDSSQSLKLSLASLTSHGLATLLVEASSIAASENPAYFYW